MQVNNLSSLSPVSDDDIFIRLSGKGDIAVFFNVNESSSDDKRINNLYVGALMMTLTDKDLLQNAGRRYLVDRAKFAFKMASMAEPNLNFQEVLDHFMQLAPIYDVTPIVRTDESQSN